MEWKVRREIFEGKQYGYSQIVHLADARDSSDAELLRYRNNTLIRARHVPANAREWNKRLRPNSREVATSAEMIESGLIDLLEQIKETDALFFSLVVPRFNGTSYTLVGENRVYATPLNEYEMYILRRIAPGKIKGEKSRVSDLWFAFKYLKDDLLLRRENEPQ